MIQVIYRRSGFRIASIWFAHNRDYLFEKKCDIAYYHQMDNCVEYKQKKTLHYTLITNLLPPEEEILSRFHKSVKYKIRRAERAGIDTIMYTSTDLLEDYSTVTEFCKLYNQFLKTKNLPGKCNINAINAYLKANTLFITCARHNGKNLVYHASVGDGNIIRLIYSASLFRLLRDSDGKLIIGEANRLLHRDEILFFKKMGYSTYDWGGISTGEEVKSIAEFKLSFGGDLIEIYNCIIPCTLIGKIILSMRSCLEYLRTAVNQKGV